ncbi:hypothetical protein LRY65_02955 [Candidatus Woesebacteria bacterium]|nr:hypothetical protein [Candidatus Woesebacteria bacterium]MCD8507726.1 hypothetical protein [Candidatus Woesebacteria bacterium]MCD8527149.1 hypothetical protein [Candidatus Woesebacteria bacterium]MCD8546815.1 hypothetical protein [Candidatus Woesebacteria bacterium]
MAEVLSPENMGQQDSSFWSFWQRIFRTLTFQQTSQELFPDGHLDRGTRHHEILNEAMPDGRIPSSASSRRSLR